MIMNKKQSGVEEQDLITRQSGKPCPVSGEWETIGPHASTVILSKNQVMPLYCGKIVTWKLIRRG